MGIYHLILFSNFNTNMIMQFYAGYSLIATILAIFMVNLIVIIRKECRLMRIKIKGRQALLKRKKVMLASKAIKMAQKIEEAD